MKNFKLALSALLFSAALTQTAAAYDVFPGCAAPTPQAGRIFYVDAVNGKKTNDGSAQRPWRQLSEVMAKSPAFQPGDTIYVMNGEYDRPLINTKNTGFVKIAAAPGQKPTIKGFAISNGSKWIISGFNIHRPRNGEGITSAMITFGGTVSDIIIDNNNIYGAPDVSAMTQEQWRNYALPGVMARAADTSNCVHITNNIFTNTYATAVGLFINKSLFSHNTIDNFLNDGIQFGADDLLIADNRITNGNDPGDGLHMDGMQGFTPGGANMKQYVKNVTITRNVVIRQTNPNLKFPSYMQGISAFDRDWTNLEVSNNIVVTNAYHGMFWGMVHHSRVVNNVVVSDERAVASTDGKRVWLQVGNGASDVIVSNNMSEELIISGGNPTVVASNNMANRVSLLIDGKQMGAIKPGTYGDKNIIPAAKVNTNFLAFNTKTLTYDLHLKPDSMAIGSGNAAAAPAVDLEGKRRTLPADMGAYTKPISKMYQGQVFMVANARLLDNPKLRVIVNGVDLGAQEITANVGAGKVAGYSFDFSLPSKPEKIEVVLEGYDNQVIRPRSVTIFNFDLVVNGKRYGLRRTVPSKATKGTVIESNGIAFFTNGSTFEVDTSKLPL